VYPCHFLKIAIVEVQLVVDGLLHQQVLLHALPTPESLLPAVHAKAPLNEGVDGLVAVLAVVDLVLARQVLPQDGLREDALARLEEGTAEVDQLVERDAQRPDVLLRLVVVEINRPVLEGQVRVQVLEYLKLLPLADTRKLLPQGEVFDPGEDGPLRLILFGKDDGPGAESEMVDLFLFAVEHEFGDLPDDACDVGGVYFDLLFDKLVQVEPGLLIVDEHGVAAVSCSLDGQQVVRGDPGDLTRPKAEELLAPVLAYNVLVYAGPVRHPKINLLLLLPSSANKN
jgi:hypothetical protein